MLLNQALVPTMELRVFLAQDAQPLLQGPGLSVYLRPMPCAGDPAWQEQQHCQHKAQRDRSTHHRALVA